MVGLGVTNVGCLRPSAAAMLRVALLSLAAMMAQLHSASSQPSDYPSTSLVPRSQSDSDGNLSHLDPSAPADEAQRGMTESGTPVAKRNEDAFPAEQRNLFSDVDMVAGPNGLQPFDYSDDHGGISNTARDAIRGKNTWILWGEGNEVFWNWVQQHGYGLTDFLILMDSRQRGERFAKSGLINQPGMKAQTDPTKRVLGLYLDQADGDQILLKPPAADGLAARIAQNRPDLFEPGDPELYRQTLAQLPNDGVDPGVYGYPSGIVGLRLMPNPDFFGKTEAARKARGYWKDRVENAKDDAYYTETAVNADPDLVRPFRVSMSCGFCHIAPHPLNPPADPEKPQWSNLSTTIGDQYWRPVSTFTDLKKPESFLYQFLASQQPGTIDTSLVATDHINNANTITAIFDLPARLVRAGQNPPERQNSDNQLIPQIEDPQPGTNPRHTPRVLLDGSDSVGVFGALSRVYLNIGTYSEEWKRLQNLLIGFTPQQPFAVATAIAKSVYWRTADKYRIPYLAAFFTYMGKDGGGSVTRPMYLADTPEGGPILQAEHDAARSGRGVFIENCAICHSSKQPSGVSLGFSRDWAKPQTASTDASLALTLPMDFADWTQFTKSEAYAGYIKQIDAFAGVASDQQDDFIKDNFLSTDIRVPVTLVGTNSGRAVATNGMRGQVWDNFTSETYKSLPPVGDVRFFNPFSGQPVDQWGNNDSYDPPAGGPGYYRPASLIGLWATAPFLHNNTLGEYTGDPSIKSRLKAFDDGIDKILWSAKRESSPFRLPGDLRGQMAMADGDRGFIYRTPQVSWIDFPARFIRPLVTGVIGEFWVSFLSLYLWIGLTVVMLALVFFGRLRHAGFVFALVAVLAAAVLRGSRVDTVYPVFWLVPVAAVIIAAILWLVIRQGWVAKIVFALLAVVTIGVGMQANAFINGKMGDLKIGPVPAGTPVNLLMNINPQASMGDLLAAVSGMTRGFLRIHKDHLTDNAAWQAFRNEAARPLIRASKCPDFVLDRGHWFAETLSDQKKMQLKAFLKTI